jgi:hypothetical protein
MCYLQNSEVSVKKTVLLCAFSIGVLAYAQSNVQIVSSLGYEDGNYGQIIGEVINKSSSPQEYVKIVASLYDKNDKFMGSEFTYSQLETLNPKEKTTFEISARNIIFAKYRLQIQSRDAKPAPRNIKVLSSNGQYDGKYYEVVGEVQNMGRATAEYVKIVFTGYADAEKTKIAGTSFTYSQLDKMPANSTSPFEISIKNPPKQIVAYTLSAQSR